MKATRGLIIIAWAFCSLAYAVNGNDWNAAPQSARLQEMKRILGNIEAKGCRVKNSPEYFVRQINDFYQERSTRNIELHRALGLIATGAGEDWKC